MNENKKQSIICAVSVELDNIIGLEFSDSSEYSLEYNYVESIDMLLDIMIEINRLVKDDKRYKQLTDIVIRNLGVMQEAEYLEAHNFTFITNRINEEIQRVFNHFYNKFI